MAKWPMDDNHIDATSLDAAQVEERSSIAVGALIRFAVIAVVLAAVVIFVLQNLNNVPVDFLSWSFEAPLVLLLVGAGLFAVALSSIVGFVRSRRR